MKNERPGGEEKGKIRADTSRDNSSYDVGPLRKAGGSATNLSHSLSGSKANQRGK